MVRRCTKDYISIGLGGGRECFGPFTKHDDVHGREPSGLGACSSRSFEQRLDGGAVFALVLEHSSGTPRPSITRAGARVRWREKIPRDCLPVQALPKAHAQAPRHPMSPIFTPYLCLSRPLHADMSTAAPYGLVTRVPEDCAVQLVGADGLPASRDDGSDVAEVRIIEADGACGKEWEEEETLDRCPAIACRVPLRLAGIGFRMPRPAPFFHPFIPQLGCVDSLDLSLLPLPSLPPPPASRVSR